MKQNSIKMYTQALCCALAVCSASDFACGMDIMDVRQEKVKDISAGTAISCLQDIDKAASIVLELHNKGGAVSKEDIYAAFEKVGIPEDEVIPDPSELTVPPSGTSFVWISEGRVSTLAMYLCSRIYMDLPFENKFTDAVSYEFDRFSKEWNEYSNYEICVVFLDLVRNVLCDGIYEYIGFYCNYFNFKHTRDKDLRSNCVLALLFEKWANVCFEIERYYEKTYG